MRPFATKRDLVMALYPSSTGMGWVAFEGPLSVFDWAIFTAKWDKNRKCLRKLDKLLQRLQPQVLVLEVFDGDKRRRACRIRKLCRKMMKVAAERGVHVEIYAREEVAACFAELGASTREEIAAAITRLVDGFEHRLPPRRRPWMSEDPRMALFNAAALALTHYRHEAELVLQDKRGLG